MLFDWKVLTYQLLQNNAAARLGNLSGGIEDIIGHDWFANIDFNKFRSQKVPAPWLPDVKDPLDSSNSTNAAAELDISDQFTRKLSAEDQDEFKGF